MAGKRTPEQPSRTRKRDRFELDGQWLAREPGRANWYRCWLDSVAGRVRRRTLGTPDFGEAQKRLATLILAEVPKTPDAPGTVLMASLLANYMDNHGRHVRAFAAARRACELCLGYLKNATGSNTPTVADFSLPRQYAFMKWLRLEHSVSAKTISTYLSTIKAAAVFAAKPRIVTDARGQEREGQMIVAPIYIEASEAVVCKVTGAPPSKPRDFMPTDAQLGAFIDAIDQEHVFRYVVIALNTWARPEAITQSDFSRQANFDTGLLNLNPPGRVQNRKFRPTIKITDNLRGWLLHWRLPRPILFHGEPVAEISPKTFKKFAIKAGVPEMVRYSLRHFMNTRAMRVPRHIRPDREERAVWMGHPDTNHSQTQHYERFDPDYLKACAAATDAIMIELNQLTSRSLFAPGAIPGAGLTVVTNHLVNDAKQRGSEAS